MRRPKPLPRRLGDRFAIRAAAAAGVGRSRRDGRDLARPFHGARARSAPASFRDLVDCYRAIMLPGQVFVGPTAMRLWGLPLPDAWSAAEPLHVCVGPDAAPPRGAGVKIEYEGDGHRTEKEQWRADIRRQRRLEDLGWIVIRLTESDLADPSAFLGRLARARAARLESITA